MELLYWRKYYDCNIMTKSVEPKSTVSVLQGLIVVSIVLLIVDSVDAQLANATHFDDSGSGHCERAADTPLVCVYVNVCSLR